MNIKTNLSHEKKGGKTMALFGAPHLFYAKSGGTLYVDCHLIAFNENPELEIRSRQSLNEIFSLVFPELPAKTQAKLKAYAKKLARLYASGRGLKVSNGSIYQQNTNWCGFYFHLKKLEA